MEGRRWRKVQVRQRLASELVQNIFFFSSRRRHTRFDCDWSSDVCSSDLVRGNAQRRPREAADDRAAREPAQAAADQSRRGSRDAALSHAGAARPLSGGAAALSGQGGRADPPPPATAPPAGDGAQAGGAPATLAHRSPTPPSRSRLAAPCALAISLPAGGAERVSDTRQCESRS